MKVLHVSESLIGGPASYLEETLPYQTQLFGADNIALLAPESQREYIAASISCVVETYTRTGRNPRSVLALGLAIRRSIRRHNPDVIHLHSSIAGAIGRLVIAGMSRRPHVVYCAHCWSFDRPQQTAATRLWAAIERALSLCADVIVNISPHEESLLRRVRFPLANTRLIVSGIKDLVPNPGNDRVAGPRQGTRWRLLFVGRLDRQKGIDLLLRDFASLKPDRATLRLVGAKVLDNFDLDIPAEVRLSDWVPRETLPALFEEFDAVIMPSRWEGMPLLAIEALRSGRPLICSSHGAFPYFIQDGVNGILIDIATPGWLDKALTVLDNSDLEAMSVAARATYLAMFEPERMNRDLVDLYGSLLERRQGQTEAAMARANIQAPGRTEHPAAISRSPP